MIWQVWCILSDEEMSKLVVMANCWNFNVHLIHVISRNYSYCAGVLDSKLHGHLDLCSAKMPVCMVVLWQVVSFAGYSSLYYSFKPSCIPSIFSWCN